MKTINRQFHTTQPRPIKILQFGEGNFLRAFIDDFIQVLNETTDFNGNIAVIQPLATGRVKELANQDGLYTLLLEGKQSDQVVHEQRVIDVLQDFINPYEDYETFLAYSESKDLKLILSNTTEAGIHYDKTDLCDTVVSPTYPGKLLTFLKKRYDFFNGDQLAGLYILPCELIDQNGTTLRDVLVKLSQARLYCEEFTTWLVNANHFYNTLVDRIVPGYPKDQITMIEGNIGFHDQNIVKGEIFHLWVIEGDRSLCNVLPIDKTNLNIVLTDNIKPYKERKVKILNGSHTCMVPIAYQCGFREVSAMMQDNFLSSWLHNFLSQEVWPTISLSKEELLDFTNDVMDRFANPTIHHELLTISLNSMTKYKTRILSSAISYYDINAKLPTHALFSLASLFAMYRLSNEQGESLIVDDEYFMAMWKRLWSNNTIEEIVLEVMNLSHWEYDFEQMKGSKAYVRECLSDIVEYNMEYALHKHFG